MAWLQRLRRRRNAAAVQDLLFTCSANTEPGGPILPMVVQEKLAASQHRCCPLRCVYRNDLLWPEELGPVRLE